MMFVACVAVTIFTDQVSKLDVKKKTKLDVEVQHILKILVIVILLSKMV